MLNSIISGAQTGADRAGLDAAIALGLQPGGWIPRGRKTDEGPLDEYDRIKADGYAIDVRGALPVLIKGQYAERFSTWMEALEAAEAKIVSF